MAVSILPLLLLQLPAPAPPTFTVTVASAVLLLLLLTSQPVQSLRTKLRQQPDTCCAGLLPQLPVPNSQPGRQAARLLLLMLSTYIAIGSRPGAEEPYCPGVHQQNH
ncbi:hypothetical protein COO60DRAFT_706430 [Scenedesmus sp. NREL 46B-D3]|nr:hypothetical protein COO60DRAFT_706430 [Scenedesmus sp. NREL 46B-D3]